MKPWHPGNWPPTAVVSKVGEGQRPINTAGAYVTDDGSFRRYLTEEQDFQKYRVTDAIQGFDLVHQLSRLRLGKNLPDAEVELIVRTLSENVGSYEQVVEVCCPLYNRERGKEIYCV